MSKGFLDSFLSPPPPPPQPLHMIIKKKYPKDFVFTCPAPMFAKVGPSNSQWSKEVCMDTRQEITQQLKKYTSKDQNT